MVQHDSALVAKIYHRPTESHTRKLGVMLANPPIDPETTQQHSLIAWPLDLLHTDDGNRRVVGFLMQRVSGMSPIIDFYHPRTRRRQRPWFDYSRLHLTARNIAAAMHALHNRGYVIGDVNESNILVADNARVTLVDTDSFQVRELHNGVVYRCPVGKPEFTPPELQGRNFASIDRALEHDLFGLAVLIFQLLMEGTHPFAGRFQGGGDPPPYAERIAAGHFPYGRQRVPYAPPTNAPPFDILHPTL
jgi:DNA-binding helix-hairpin-helix protein with protein kinase domain